MTIPHPHSSMLLPQSYVRLAAPITLDLRVRSGPRPRVIQAGGTEEILDAGHEPAYREFAEFPMTIVISAQSREISAILSPIPSALQLYGPEDFAAACADTMEDHCQRVLDMLGNDPTTALQAMIDGDGPPVPSVRVPREIENWRAKAVLAAMGLTALVEGALIALPEPQRSLITVAWHGGAKVARRGPAVLGIASALGLTDAQLDAMFIQAAALVI